MAGANILTDEKILSIIKNNSLYANFPAIHAIQKTLYTPPKKESGGCSKCQRNRMAKSSASMQNAVKSFKKYIKGIDAGTRNSLKQALGLSELRFTMVDSDGRIKEFRY